MTQQAGGHNSHVSWLEDIEYRKEFGSESAKLEIAAALVRARERANITQSALAELAGTSQAYIAKLESGDANPTVGNIGRLFACMWQKPGIEPTPMAPSTPAGPVRDLSDSGAGVQYAGAYAPPSAYPNSGSSSSSPAVSSDGAAARAAVAGRGRRPMSAS